MFRSNTTIMIVGIVVGLIFTGLPCLEAQSPMGSPVMSPGVPIASPDLPTVMSPSSPTAMAPAPDCMTALTNVTDCLTFVQEGSNLTVPDKNCCPEFAGLLESNPICLCEMIGQAATYSIDLKKAEMLPSVCKVETPPLSACPGISPASAPTPDTANDMAPGSIIGASPGPGGAAASPSESGTNGASSTAVNNLSTIICLAIAIFVAYYF